MEWLLKFVESILGWLGGKVDWRRVWRWKQARDLSPAEGTHFTILVADLAGDGDLNQTHHVAAALAGQLGIHVRRFGRVLDEPSHGDLADGLAAVERRGREWLAAQNADILIWGRVKKPDQVLLLRFLAASESVSSGGKPYPLTQETIELPANFNEDLATALTAVALSAVSPATEERGRYLVHVLKPVATKLDQLRAHPPRGLTPIQQGRIHGSYGITAGVLGKQTGESEWLERAVTAFRAALEVSTRERVLFDWAATQNNLGNALRILGEREEGTERLEQAVAAFQAALKAQTRKAVPLDWARTQNNLGNALSRLGEREEGTERLKQAVAAYRTALEVRTRERVPLDWAMTQNNLGGALLRLGEREEGTGRLEKAIAAYRGALEVRTRERVPLDWATTQSNLGVALQALGEREEGTERLEQALAAYRAALEVRTRERVPLDWATTQNNLGNALRALGEREEGTERLEQAVAAYRAALEVFEPARAQHYARKARRNLARAEALVAARREQGGEGEK